MRLLLDESLPRKLAAALVGHEVETVQRRGWAGLKNGHLLAAAAKEFDILLTGDRNLEFQQNLGGLPIAVVVLVAFNNRIESLLPLVPELLAALDGLPPGRLVHVGGR